MKHILFDLKDCLFDNLLDNEEYIQESLQKASEVCGSKVLKIETHKFDPQGVTGYALLAESHLSIHTWPENSLAKCDIFTCSYANHPNRAVEFLKERFHATEVRRWACDRSSGIDMVL